MKSLLVSCAFVTLVAALPVSAQEESVSQDFFGKDFANSMLADVTVENANRSPKPARENREPRQPRVPIAGIGSVIPGGNSRDDRTIGSDRTLQRRISKDQEDRPGKSIQFVELYVNSLNRTHFEAQMKNLEDLVSRTSPAWLYVGAVGDFRNVSDRWTRWAESHNGSVSSVTSPPGNLKVTQSPTWVIQTSDNQYIFEGFEKISSLFNSKGELVLPEDQPATSDETSVDKGTDEEPAAAEF